jgi:hypothetical protein
MREHAGRARHRASACAEQLPQQLWEVDLMMCSQPGHAGAADCEHRGLRCSGPDNRVKHLS